MLRISTAATANDRALSRNGSIATALNTYAPTDNPTRLPATTSAARRYPFARGRSPLETSVGRNACALLSNTTSHAPTSTSSASSTQIDNDPAATVTATTPNSTRRTTLAPTMSTRRSPRSTATPTGSANTSHGTMSANVVSESTRSSSVRLYA